MHHCIKESECSVQPPPHILSLFVHYSSYLYYKEVIYIMQRRKVNGAIRPPAHTSPPREMEELHWNRCISVASAVKLVLPQSISHFLDKRKLGRKSE